MVGTVSGGVISRSQGMPSPYRVAPLRVASVPSGHVYIRHLRPVADESPFVTLADPDPQREDRPAGAVWWPPVMLDAGWVERHHDEFDVFHVHFGFDAVSPADLDALAETLRRHAKPLVYTVHDLRNPHHTDPSIHDAHLDVLIPAADELITLTPRAAEHIARRWGRDALVLPHPHVVPLADMPRLQQRHRRQLERPFTIGVHVKSLRPSMDPLPVLRVLRSALRDLPGTRLRVDGHRDLLEPGGARHHAELAGTLAAWASAGEIDLSVHDFFSDDELWTYLADLDVSVLPYRFGTHSGWLEACHDIGTRVVAPTAGCYDQQGPVSSYRWDSEAPAAPLDEESLVAAIHDAHEHRSSVAATVRHRTIQRDAVAAAHDCLYRCLMETPS